MATEGPHLLKPNIGIIMLLVGLKNVNGPNSKKNLVLVNLLCAFEFTEVHQLMPSTQNV